MKYYYIQTFGCQMNEYDTERMGSILEKAGYMPSAEPKEASVIIVNTCSVREKPQNKVNSLIGRVKSLKKKNPELVVGVSGCVAQQEGDKLLKQFKQLDFVMGTDSIIYLTEIIEKVKKGKRICVTEVNKGDLSIPVFERHENHSASVTIMKGCDNFCSYCIVPYVRGREKSRKPQEIIDEIKYSVERGAREIILLGQNVNSYGAKSDIDLRFPELLRMVNNIDGLSRIRFVTSHPKDFSGELAAVMKECSKVCEFLHLPLQAGSDKILKMMNRGYTYSEYKDKILMAKELMPELALSSDFITGFPTETEEDFQCTLNALNEMKYESIYAFNYSVRPGTGAVKFGDDVPHDVKNDRLSRLLNVQKKITAELSKQYENKIVEVLVEGPSKRKPEEYKGRNRQNRVVNFSSSQMHCEGDIVFVNIVDAKPNSLYGKVTEQK